MKLKLSKMNLRSGNLNDIIGVINHANSLILLDISWGQLLPKELAAISQALAQHARSLRNLNLSYNRLNFDEEGP